MVVVKIRYALSQELIAQVDIRSGVIPRKGEKILIAGNEWKVHDITHDLVMETISIFVVDSKEDF